jgi:very-short-patch-repair endonuclease
VDFANVDMRIAVEIEGGTWSLRAKSRHTTGSGFHNDCHKYNELSMMGWIILRGDAKMVKDLSLLKYLERAIKFRSKEDQNA